VGPKTVTAAPSTMRAEFAHETPIERYLRVREYPRATGYGR
jgi:hypothetical protein